MNLKRGTAAPMWKEKGRSVTGTPALAEKDPERFE